MTHGSLFRALVEFDKAKLDSYEQRQDDRVDWLP